MCSATKKILRGRIVESVLDEAIDGSDKYLIYLPPDYGTQRDNWPAIVYLHGHSGGNYDKTPEMLQGDGLLYFISQLNNDIPAILIAPLTENVEIINRLGHSFRFISEVIRAAQRDYSIDAERLSITGMSLGAIGTWNMLFAYPGLFSAAAPVAGMLGLDAGERPEVWATAFQSLRGNRVRIFHSPEDEIVPFKHGAHAYSMAKRAGLDVEFIEKSGSHIDTAGQTYNHELVEWMMQYRRMDRPAPLQWDRASIAGKYGDINVAATDEGIVLESSSDPTRRKSLRHIGAHRFVPLPGQSAQTQGLWDGLYFFDGLVDGRYQRLVVSQALEPMRAYPRII